jgi:hypothetical protein
MSSHRVLAFLSVTALFATAVGCETAPGVAGPSGQNGSSTSSGGGAGGSGGTSATAGGGTAGGGVETPCDCGPGFECCDGACVNVANDILNCGGCGVACQGPSPFCDGSQCAPPPCEPEFVCDQGGTCCGASCCGAGEICCEINTGEQEGIGAQCVVPVNGTCPVGCPTCN